MQDEHDENRDEAAFGRIVARAGEALSELMARPLEPGLYLVATPIGNLADISLRALAVLARADVIAAEDTRHSKKLLSHFAISAEMTAYHEHNAERERPKLIARLRAGESIALISDAGTPLISDPGYKLVREALDAGIAVRSIPGASAVLAALTSSGLPTDTFLFAGFLPPKQAARRNRLEQVKTAPATLIFFETGPRLGASLTDMAVVLGPRAAVIARELTKLHETISRGSLDKLAAEAEASGMLKGEFVVVVGPPEAEETDVSDAKIVEQLEKALNLESFRDAVRSVAEVLQVPRSRVYEIGLKLKRTDG
ncbi:16S rRNA (cytidine(1402)-2'-O)-methyltransferase [Methyloceanibacter sp.]|uniref:16S rRNA (cytidine(1402)-2'-O)-methyltransferase n=1 Tax=Methyloceanibacter sp. TaxID=1965321 RepID=UPI002D2DE61C|nr:16S rRNA (cytidine(1402)-2'-O)-methyltransferase [Methyloceanibacter sp.]HZP10338.1 16S rRNA (cytidine(1402)-2'-O)-methyltransferase [Methyloceanibacter sp.]